MSNLKSALGVEPGNLELIHYAKRCEDLRSRDLPPVPWTTRQERRANPFLRTRVPAAVQAARGHDASTPPDPVAVFATLRQWKNEIR